MNIELSPERKLLLETIVKDKIGLFLKMLPNMVKVATSNTPGLEDVKINKIKEMIKKIAKESAEAKTKPRTVEGKVKKVRGMDRNFGKVIIDGRRMAKSRAAYHQIKYLLPKLIKTRQLTPAMIESAFPKIRIYPAMVMFVDQIPLKDKHRFYTKETDLIKGKKGQMMAISNQWSTKEYKALERIAKKHDFMVQDAPK